MPVSESRQIVAALRARGHEVAYLQLDAEGHEFRRASSRRRLLVAITGFLQRSICGPAGPGSPPQPGRHSGQAAHDR